MGLFSEGIHISSFIRSGLLLACLYVYIAMILWSFRLNLCILCIRLLMIIDSSRVILTVSIDHSTMEASGQQLV